MRRDRLQMNDRNVYLNEYSSENVVKAYSSKTAGKGIQYNLAHVYGQLYADTIDTIVSDTGGTKPLRILEYGCGAGMNLIHVVNRLILKKVPLEMAIGTDFSKLLIETADMECATLISPEYRSKIKFFIASNEALLDDLTEQLSVSRKSMLNTFDLIIGVNTFRYACRLKMQQQCARDIAYLLVDGGYTIMIDMNKNFPFFRSKFRDRKARQTSRYWLPSLEEYAAPFVKAGLVVTQKRNFCWMPHSANGVIYVAARFLSPILDLIAPDFAMRSLVVAKKCSITDQQKKPF